jgi:hypothetical protein
MTAHAAASSPSALTAAQSAMADAALIHSYRCTVSMAISPTAISPKSATGKINANSTIA